MTPQVSVIVPTNSRLNLLKETLQSILSQTFQDLELIVVDNMSSDGTEEFMRGLKDPRVRYFRNSNNGIISVNRNFGIHQAKGKYIAFCDDDDLWFPDKLKKQLALFPEEGISCVSTDFIPIGDPRFLRKAFTPDRRRPFKDFRYEDILLLNPVISSSVIARRDFLLEAGSFDENPDFRFIEDWELWLRLCRKGKLRILTEPLLKYRMTEKMERDSRQITVNTLKVLEKHRRLGYADSAIFRKAQGMRFVAIGKAFLDNNDREGLAFFRRGFMQSRDKYQMLKALTGIFLYYLPQTLRKGLLNFIYSIRRRETT